ncbi:MAG TPA: N-acetyltransferase [Ruminococcaceae bacterium]|nr:N-acetyltransferase [Oscillospiraceae bacterium]
MNYTIRKIRSGEVEEALALALEVFMQFEAPAYKPEGTETFKRDIVENKEFIQKCRNSVCPIYAAYDRGKIIGIIGMRSNKTHINLVFTKKEYHRKGVATAIFNFLTEDLLKENPSLEEITLNSSPYGLPFYLHLGFEPLSEEQETEGVRYTPMKYRIKKEELI